ncbi:GNAT family N-acetyltransferase [Metasolibacillus sp.]|uniref:GNAT family N-acetyltransferase n=1 Tax=Metasolibacillus sp. TaxID=2703680 RepID=UPI0025D24150|nr:GNAT family N-acetyltransferase [Metasolibacillus sp.]MCT6924811.1 GNAT family N-acetyltransferase [Metasolibacillus sp.]MCT6941079.1 GNAT family N-acetyltransferase [Metasolibacillus sp.]
MANYEFIKDYCHNESIRESFNELAMKIFELDFRPWYERGYWNEQYVPYSFIDNGKVIANASINKMTVVIDGEKYSAIQIGTVMTDESYRSQGLSRKLMQHVMDEYEAQCDFMFLFANETVLDFYPKFGFTRIDESEFSLDLEKNPIEVRDTKLKQLTIENDSALLEKFAQNRFINSNMLDVENNANLLMFYFTIPFKEAIFYIEDLETIVLMEEEEGTLHIFDIIALDAPNMEAILASVVKVTTKKVICYFTMENMPAITKPNDDDALFVFSKKPLLMGNFMFPLTGHC